MASQTGSGLTLTLKIVPLTLKDSDFSNDQSLSYTAAAPQSKTKTNKKKHHASSHWPINLWESGHWITDWHGTLPMSGWTVVTCCVLWCCLGSTYATSCAFSGAISPSSWTLHISVPESLTVRRWHFFKSDEMWTKCEENDLHVVTHQTGSWYHTSCLSWFTEIFFIHLMIKVI